MGDKPYWEFTNDFHDELTVEYDPNEDKFPILIVSYMATEPGLAAGYSMPVWQLGRLIAALTDIQKRHGVAEF